VRGDGGGEGGPGPDLDPQCRGGVQGWRRTRGRRLARARTAPLRWRRLPTRSGPRSCGAIGDQREAVRSGGRARHPCRHHSGERDLIQAEGGGRCGAYRDGKTGKPQRGLSRPRRPTGTGHRRPAIRGRHRDGPRAAYSAPRACSSGGLRRCRERRREGSTRLGAAVTCSRWQGRRPHESDSRWRGRSSGTLTGPEQRCRTGEVRSSGLDSSLGRLRPRKPLLTCEK
jgi:hypothetical protein